MLNAKNKKKKIWYIKQAQVMYWYIHYVRNKSRNDKLSVYFKNKFLSYLCNNFVAS